MISYDVGLYKHFLDMAKKESLKKKTLINWTLPKWKTLTFQKTLLGKCKENSETWGKYLQNIYLTELCLEYKKKYLKSNTSLKGIFFSSVKSVKINPILLANK